MAWYRAGTVAVTAASNVVTGNTTSWVGPAQVGYAFVGPDGRTYEITQVVSATSLRITPNYAGATATGQAYSIMPTHGGSFALREAVEELIAEYEGQAGNAAIGRHPAGSLTSPGVHGDNDGNSGFLWLGDGTVVYSADGTERVRMGPLGIDITGLLYGDAIQASKMDVTPGRVLTTDRAYGLGGTMSIIGNASVIDNTIIANVWQSYSTSQGSTGGPAGVTTGAILTTRRVTTGGETQTLVCEAGSSSGAQPGAIYTRSRTSGAWSVWRSASIHSSGDDWTRYVDGRQECDVIFDDAAAAWNVAMGTGLWMRETAGIVWNYPVPFVSFPNVQATASRTAAIAVGCGTRSPSLTTVTLYPWAAISTGAGLSKSVHASAKGRWYD